MNKTLGLILSIGLALLLITSGVHADAQARDSCDALKLHLGTVELPQGSQTQKTFVLENQALENFTVEYLEAYDYNSGIIVSAAEYDKIVRGTNRGFLKVNINSLKNSDIENATGFIGLSGHFQSGKICSFEKQKLDIRLSRSTEQTQPEFIYAVNFSGNTACSLTLNVPSRVLVKAHDSVTFFANNTSSKEVSVKVTGNNVDVLNAETKIPARSSASLRVYFDILNGVEKTNVQWTAGSETCNYSVQSTELVNLSPALPAAPVQQTPTTGAGAQGTTGTATAGTPTDPTAGASAGSNTNANATPISSLDPVSAALVVWNSNTPVGIFLLLVIVGGALWYRFKIHPKKMAGQAKASQTESSAVVENKKSMLEELIVEELPEAQTQTQNTTSRIRNIL